MKRLGPIGAVLAFSCLGWVVNRGPTATATGGSTPRISSASGSRALKVAGAEAPVASDACTAYLPANGSTTDENRGEALGVIRAFTGDDPGDLEYVIALVPDPRHSRLSLLFDRAIDAIEDAAQDEHFSFDSDWLPWSVEGHSYGSREDDVNSRKSMQSRENCPGILLFRSSVSRADDAQPADRYHKGLAVLVIAEQTTGGLNAAQWDSALAWLHAQGWPKDGAAVRVLGPTFSGTLPSLQRRLSALERGRDKAARPDLYIYSGTVGACESVRWFQHQVSSDPQARFGVFQENDELQIHRFLDYLNHQQEPLNTVAILSEDETAYGGSIDSTSGDNDCNPLRGLVDQPDKPTQPVMLFYPRDISALRAAYQAESIFTKKQQQSAEGAGSQAVLNEDLQNEQTEEGDTPPSYSKQQTAMSQEAQLYAIATFLRTHHSQYIILRGSNPLDALFLTRFLHKVYPEGRVVLLGSEILFTREVDNTEFRGTLSLSNFPLIPRLQHWSQIFPVGTHSRSHSHRVFSGNFGEGTYIAARFLLDSRTASPDPSSGKVTPEDSEGHLRLPAFNATVLDIADPYWVHQSASPLASMHANTWLTVLGRDGFWPVDVLTNVDRLRHNCPGAPGDAQPNQETADPYAPPSSEAEIAPCNGEYLPMYSMGMKPPMPWYFAMALAVIMLIRHMWQYRSPQESLVCRAREDAQYKFLTALSTAIVFTASVLLIVPFGSIWRLHLWDDWAITALLFVPLALAIAAPFFVHPTVKGKIIVGEAIALILFFVVLWIIGLRNVMFYYRALHLTNGVSPLLPFLFLLAGLYTWAWQSLAGNALLGDGRPQLPASKYLDWRYFRASAAMANRIDAMARTCSFSLQVAAAPVAVTGLILVCFRFHSFVLSFEGFWYSVRVNIALVIVLIVIAGGAARLLRTWKELKRLLVQLGRMPLARTFYALKDISVRSLWAMSTQVPRTQYKFFGQQMQALKRVISFLPASTYDSPELQKELTEMQRFGDQFSKSYLTDLDNTARWQDEVKSDKETRHIREMIANCGGMIMRDILSNEWDGEVRSEDYLLQNKAIRGGAPGEADSGHVGKGEKEGGGAEPTPPPVSAKAVIRAAEEFVCILYISYIQNILARMRTMVIATSAVYIAAMLALAFYPFAPKPAIAIWMMVVLLGLGLVVGVVYAGLERDQVLSYITDTNTSLGTEFWLKYATFIVPPLLALLTAQFPEIADSIVQWVQPGLDAIK